MNLEPEQAAAWNAVLRAYERGDAIDVAREVERQIERLYELGAESQCIRHQKDNNHPNADFRPEVITKTE